MAAAFCRAEGEREPKRGVLVRTGCASYAGDVDRTARDDAARLARTGSVVNRTGSMPNALCDSREQPETILEHTAYRANHHRAVCVVLLNQHTHSSVHCSTLC